MPAEQEIQNPQDIYSRLREWYLARLRSEALELSRKAGLTPFSRIHADRQLLEQLVNSAVAPVEKPHEITLKALPFLIWTGLVVVCFLVMVVQTGPGLAVSEVFEATLGVLLFLRRDQWVPMEAIVSFLFVSIPLLLSSTARAEFFFACRSASPPKSSLLLSESTTSVRVKSLLVLTTAILMTGVFGFLLWNQVQPAVIVPPMVITALVWLCFGLSSMNLCDHWREFSRKLRERRVTQLALPILTSVNLDATSDLLDSLTRSLLAVSAREHLIADFAGDLTMVLDQQLDIRACNRTSVRLLGYLPEELASRNFCELFMQTDVEELKALLIRERANGPLTKELCSVSKHGDLVDLSVCFDWSEAQRLYFVMARDISDEKRAERTRSEYLATISHDVRAPLCSILLGLNSVRAGIYGAVTEESNATLLRSERNVQRIIDLLSETIDLEHSTESDIPLKLEECQIEEIVASAMEQTKDLAAHLSVRVLSDVESQVIRIDHKRILRVLVNLLTNAIKHSPAGGEVTLSSRVDSQKVRLEVRDNGPGIPPQLAVAVFNRYYQVAEGRGNLSGSGLGLAICKLFVELHGGIIGVNSTGGKGSTFWFAIPIREGGHRSVLL